MRAQIGRAGAIILDVEKDHLVGIVLDDGLCLVDDKHVSRYFEAGLEAIEFRSPQPLGFAQVKEMAAHEILLSGGEDKGGIPGVHLEIEKRRRGDLRLANL